ncbi:MAG: hypothetical protein AAF937_03360 [Planctomycetota bacterium]
MPPNDTRRLLYVRARFGLRVERSSIGPTRRLALLEQLGESLASELPPGGIALVTGPSGAGKSVVTRAFSAAAGAVNATPVSASARRAPVNLIRGPIDDALGLLAACGLGEARRLITPAGFLSEGERARLSLARAIAHSRRGGAARDIACDEFTSTLDRLTARSVARCVRRAVGQRQRLVCATAHDDIAPHLDPDTVEHLPLVGPPQILQREKRRADSAPASVA